MRRRAPELALLKCIARTKKDVRVPNFLRTCENCAANMIRTGKLEWDVATGFPTRLVFIIKQKKSRRGNVKSNIQHL